MANNTTLNNENDLYSALPLRDGMIRVIDVHQNHTGHSTRFNTLSGQLRALTLSNKPKFFALSYTWGSKGKDESPYSIQLYASGGPVGIRISETAYQAISDVRDHCEGQLTLWIDTICINQNDSSEKETQIPLMREIYSNAEIVYVHLGRTESTDVALDWMTHISQRRYRGTGILGPGGEGAAERSIYILLLINFWTGKEFLNSGNTNSLTFYSKVVTRYLSLIERYTWAIGPIFKEQIMSRSPRKGLGDLNARKLLSINSLLNCPWIQRAWTWQELILARKAVIICGSKALSWDRFLLALSVLDLCSQKSETPSLEQIPLSRGSMMGTLVRTSRAYHKTNRHFPEDPNLGNLKTWCFLAEWWLRFGRPLTMKKGKASEIPTTFLDYHFKIYSVGVIIVTCVLFSPLLIGIACMIFIMVRANSPPPCPKGYFCVDIDTGPPPSVSGISISLGFNLFALLVSISILFELRKDMKNYCRLPIAFAIIPALRTRKATDPRDICYGFYGVLLAEGLGSLPSPDYQRDSRIIFREFLLDLIKWDSKALILLLDCCNYAEPSWSPDWQVSSRQSWLDEAYFFGNSAISATPTSVPYFDVTDDKLGLFVYGKQVSQAGVVWAGANLVANDLMIADAEKNTDARNLSIILEWIRNVLRLRSGQATNISLEDQVQIYEVLEKVEVLEKDDVRRGITIQTSSGRIKARARLSNGFTTWLKAIEPYAVGSETLGTEITVQQDADTSIARLKDSESISQCYEKLLASEKALEYHRKICNSIVHQRRLFIHYGPKRFQFSAGSLATEVGDTICLISGLPVPMILRKAGGFRKFTQDGHEGSAQPFLVIGPAYIPGMMKGEMWPKDVDAEPLPKDRMMQFYLV
jgi:hypothetical protein